VTEWRDEYGDAPDLDELTTGLPEEALATVRWAKRRLKADGTPIGELPGVREMNGMRRTALINDLARLDVRVGIRIVNPEAAAERAKLLDRLEVSHGIAPDGTEIRVLGAHANAWMSGRWPEREYRITTQWQDFPVAFANQLDYWINERADLGSWFLRDRLEKQIDDDTGEPVFRRRQVRVPEVDLFAFRLPAEIPADETKSGLKIAHK
jgi:hypothetical protein